MSHIQVPPDSSGKAVDTITLTDAGSEVHRQVVVVGGGSGTAEVVATSMSAPAASAVGLVVRQAGTATVAGTVNVNGGVALSGTATVAGVVGLTAGTAVIGDLNAISRTVQVAVATPFTLQGISTTVNVAVATPFTLQGISTTVTVAGNVNISATANVAIRSVFVATANPSASRGPRCVIVSTSSNATLVAAPGAGLAIFITGLNCTNASGSNTRARIGTSASIGQVTMMMAQSGGGFVTQYIPPWRVSTNEALVGSVKPNASEGIFNVHFFVASADAM